MGFMNQTSLGGHCGHAWGNTSVISLGVWNHQGHQGFISSKRLSSSKMGFQFGVNWGVPNFQAHLRFFCDDSILWYPKKVGWHLWYHFSTIITPGWYLSLSDTPTLPDHLHSTPNFGTDTQSSWSELTGEHAGITQLAVNLYNIYIYRELYMFIFFGPVGKRPKTKNDESARGLATIPPTFFDC